jgi:hypothetical protein
MQEKFACVANAKTFSSLISKHGSIQNYIDSFAPTESFENLLLFKEALEVTTPLKTGAQYLSNYQKTLDSGFLRNDEMSRFLAF